MSTAPDNPRERHLDEVLADYFKAQRAGAAPTRQELLEQHPDLADELTSFFRNQDGFTRLAAPLRNLVAADQSLLPRPFGGYELLQEIGRGGMGVVFKARQKNLGRVVALKMLTAGPLASSDELRRFRAEAEAAAALDHPNIVPVYEVGEDDGRPYLAMKFIEGGTLAEHAASFRQAPRAATGVVATIARAVHHAHQRGVLHRDLKPANILLQARSSECGGRTEEEFRAPSSAFRACPMVTDFGLAKRIDTNTMTHSGAIVGTPGYMAPEQASGARGAVTIAADVWGLGAVLYDLLTGRPPFRGSTLLDTLRQVVDTDPASPRALQPGLDRDLETVCLKCLARDPGQRYASAQDLADDLDRYLRGEPVTARPVGSVGRLGRWARRRPLVAGLGAGLVIAVVVGFGLVTWQWLRADALRRQAEANADAARQAEARAERHLADAEESRRRAHQAVQTFCRQAADQMRRSPELQPVCRALLEEALVYYREFLDRSGQDPRLRRELADTHRSRASVLRAVGTHRDALAAYEQALALYRELYALAPDDLGLQRRLADAVTDASGMQDTTEATLAGYREAQELYRRFLDGHPTDVELRSGLATLLHNLGSICSTAGHLEEAAGWLRQGQALYEELLREQPGKAAWIAGLAGTLHNRATVLSRDARTRPQAIAVFREANRLRRQLAEAQPGDADRQANLAGSLHALGIALASTREAEALEVFRQALTIRQRLAADHPRARRFQQDLAASYINLGVCHAQAGRKQKALENYQRARDVQDRVLRQDPQSPDLRKELAQTWFHIGTISGALDHRPDEKAALGKARELQQALVSADPNRLDYRCDLAKTLNNLAWNGLALGNPSDAREAARQAIEHSRLALDRAPQVTDYRKTLTANWGTLAEAERRLSHTRAAAEALGAIPELWPEDPRQLYQTASGLARIAVSASNPADERRRCLDGALALLRRALERGFRDTRLLQQDPSLDPLRDREDFRALVDKMTRQGKHD